MAKKPKKKPLKNAFNKAKDKIKSFIDHPQNLVISAGLAPLKPYQPIMKRKLRKIGKPEGKNLAETTNNFVKYVMGINTFEEWQFENFKNASFTTTIEDLEFAEKGEENAVGAIAIGGAILKLIPKILDVIKSLKKKEPDLEDPKNPSPDLPDDIELDQASYTLLLSHHDEMKQYLAKAGQTYSNDPVENAIKIHQLTYPNKQTFEFETLSKKRGERKEKRQKKREERKDKRRGKKEQGEDDLKKFWQNNKKEILSTIGALFVAVGTDPAPDPISQGIGKAVSATQTAIEQEVKKQTMLKTYTPLLIVAVILAIILITKKK